MDNNNGAIFEQGKQSIKIPVPVYIRASASVVGSKEGQGPFGDLFDMVGVLCRRRLFSLPSEKRDL